MKILKKLALDEFANKSAITIVMNNFYVSDGLYGSLDADKIIKIQYQLTDLSRKWGFESQKLSFNGERFLWTIAPERINGNSRFTFDHHGEKVEILEIIWDTKQDKLQIYNSINDSPKREISKWNVLATIVAAGVFHMNYSEIMSIVKLPPILLF